MKLLTISHSVEQNQEFINNPDCKDTIHVTIEYFKRIGYQPPWIAYYASVENELVGTCAFKGAPKNGKIEIAYGTFEKHRQKGIATKMCKALVELSLKTDPTIIITAQTLPSTNFSTRVLKKNGFEFAGTIMDPEDGEVWEWEYKVTF